jgi:acyl-homoserine lactone acylase PvdQ
MAPGSELIASEIQPWAAVPKTYDPPQGWVQNCNDRPWTSSYPVQLEPAEHAAGFAAALGRRSALTGQDLTPRAQVSERLRRRVP